MRLRRFFPQVVHLQDYIARLCPFDSVLCRGSLIRDLGRCERIEVIVETVELGFLCATDTKPWSALSFQGPSDPLVGVAIGLGLRKSRLDALAQFLEDGLHDRKAGADDAEIVLEEGQYESNAGVVGEIPFLKASIGVNNCAKYGNHANPTMTVSIGFLRDLQVYYVGHELTIYPLRKGRSKPPFF